MATQIPRICKLILNYKHRTQFFNEECVCTKKNIVFSNDLNFLMQHVLKFQIKGCFFKNKNCIFIVKCLRKNKDDFV